MGLRSWLLGFNPDDLKVTMAKLQSLEEVKGLKAKVDDLAEGYQDTLKELLRIQQGLEAKGK